MLVSTNLKSRGRGRPRPNPRRADANARRRALILAALTLVAPAGCANQRALEWASSAVGTSAAAPPVLSVRPAAWTAQAPKLPDNLGLAQVGPGATSGLSADAVLARAERAAEPKSDASIRAASNQDPKPAGAQAPAAGQPAVPAAALPLGTQPPARPPGGAAAAPMTDAQRKLEAEERKKTRNALGINEDPLAARGVQMPTDASTPSIPAPALEYPIDMTTALRLAEVENPDIAAARQLIGEALGVLQGASVLFLPTLNGGASLHAHSGNLQRSAGRILNLSLDSVMVGGVGATIAGTPTVPEINLYVATTDAIYEPLAARQEVAAAQFNAAATANSVLLEVANLHLNLVAAEAGLALRRASETEAREIARLLAAYAASGRESEADAQRGQTRLELFRIDVQRAEESVAVASARLAHRLHLDPVVRIRPITEGVQTIDLVDLGTPTEELIRVALQRRPEMGVRNAQIGMAETHVTQEVRRPLLPTVWFGFSGSGFAGGSNITPPNIGHMGGRTDLDVSLIWTAQNLGLGNLALVRNRRAQVGIAVGEQSKTVNMIRREVGAARAEAIAFKQTVDRNYRRLISAQNGLRSDFIRIEGAEGRPIELLDSLRLLYDSRLAYLDSVIAYDQSQFRLFVALGSPPPLSGPAQAPLPPAPIASPPLPPLASGAGEAIAPPGARSRQVVANNTPPAPSAVVRAELAPRDARFARTAAPTPNATPAAVPTTSPAVAPTSSAAPISTSNLAVPPPITVEGPIPGADAIRGPVSIPPPRPIALNR